MSVHELAEEGDIQALQKLLDATPDCVNSKNELGDTPLHCAAYMSQTSAAKLLIERGAAVNANGARGRTPFHAAAEGGAIDIVRLLLDRGAQLEVLDERGQTPLLVAANNVEVGRPSTQQVVNELLAHGAFYDLESAVLQSDLTRIKELLGEGSDVFKKLPAEKRAILVHMSVDSPDVLDLLLRSGGDANSRTKTGAFSFAPITRVNEVKAAEILLKHGADANSKNSEGQTRLQVAEENGEVEIEQFLQGHGDKSRRKK